MPELLPVGIANTPEDRTPALVVTPTTRAEAALDDRWEDWGGD